MSATVGMSMATVFTNGAKALAADLWDGSATAPSDYYIGWGTGAGTADPANTQLNAESSESRQVAEASQPSPDINMFVATLTADSPKTITNAGLLTASSAGTLVVHGDFAGVALDEDDSMTFTVKIEWAPES